MEFAFCTLDWNLDGTLAWALASFFYSFSDSVCVRISPRLHEHWRARPLRKDDEQNSRSFSLE